jgi:endonuclease YncB( thermonuclease family)
MAFRRRFPVSQRSRLLLLALAGATLMLAACQVETNPTEFAGCQTTLCCEECELLAVARVIDGDTFDSPAGRVRLFGVDTPERGERCYNEASRRLRSLAGASVRVQSGPRDRDPNGRLLYYVYTANGESIDEKLVREGLAVAWTRDGQHRDLLLSLEAEVRASGNGCLKPQSN